jgi:hypothetical protein
MAGYAVIARIDRVDPHLAGTALSGASVWPPAEPPEPPDQPEAIDLVGRPLIPILAERWTGLREAWTQTTFYLFHVEGWR